MATHVGVLDEGKLVQFGPPREIYEDPKSTYVAARLGLPRINLLPADLFGTGAPDTARQIGLRPEHIVFGEGHEAHVVRVEHLGDQIRLHLKYADHDLVTLAHANSAAQPGETVHLSIQSPLYFDENGARVR